MINTNNLNIIKELCNKIEYEVINIKKEARVNPIYDSTAFEIYQDDMKNLFSEVKNDIVMLDHSNKREYSNIFCDKDIYESIDLKRCGLSDKQVAMVYDCYIDSEQENYIWIEYADNTSKKTQESIYKKIVDSLVYDGVTARGYCQGDYDEYTIVYYKDISKEAQNTINNIIKNLKHLFTVQEYYIDLVHIETRRYTSGIEEVEEVTQDDSTSYIAYDGYSDLKEVIKEYGAQGYEVIEKY